MDLHIKKIRKEKPIEELINFSIINLDKPSGPTSFMVDLTIRKILKTKKTSHAGTLDPKVTGVLPIMIGRACKLLGYFMGHDKTYVGIMRIHSDMDVEKLKQEIKKFVGNIKQTPPVRSSVARKERERKVFSWDILEVDGRDILFECKVEAGTYIRKLISDLGEKIGGAHMLELRRTRAGIFDESSLINIYDLEKAVELWKEKGDETKLRKILIPAEIISEIFPIVDLNKASLKKLLTGKPLFESDVTGDLKGERVVGFIGNKFIGVYKKVKEGQIIARPEFVFN